MYSPVCPVFRAFWRHKIKVLSSQKDLINVYYPYSLKNGLSRHLVPPECADDIQTALLPLCVGNSLHAGDALLFRIYTDVIDYFNHSHACDVERPYKLKTLIKYMEWLEDYRDRLELFRDRREYYIQKIDNNIYQIGRYLALASNSHYKG